MADNGWDKLGALTVVIDNELKWCRKNLAGKKPTDSQKGYMRGLRQAKRFAKLTEKALSDEPRAEGGK